MKKLLFILFLTNNLFACSGLSISPAYSDSNYENNLFRKIKSLDDAKDYVKQFPDGKFKNAVLEKQFPLISQISYHYEKPKRSYMRAQYFHYDNKGNLIQKKTTFGFGKTTINIFEYDQDDHLIKKSTTTNGQTTSITEYEYNSEGNKVKETERYPKGNKDERSYKYSENGLLLASYLHINGFPIEEFAYKYDDYGIRTYSEKRSKSGIIGTRIDKNHYKYDKQKNLVENPFSGELLINGDVSSKHKGKSNYTYDEDNNLIKSNYTYESWSEKEDKYFSTSSIKVYKNDSNGLLIEERHMSQDDNSKVTKTINYEYTYVQLKNIL